ncbi:carbonic anhydrase family protein [Gaetbulibacter sp. M235]|uniref:carbonic anhydrase n=1 Tax=Gaetbulibacter sp. M235 TaxID=3126510 RepID=UPI00374E9BC6
MNKILSTILSLSLIVMFSCKNQEKEEKVTKAEEHKHWSYQGETSPEHWIEIEKNSDCDGKRQSPINIIDINTISVDSAKGLNILYSPETILNKVVNNGHSIQFDFNSGDSIVYKNEVFHLKQIHFHESSEHIINGVKYPTEIHLVHQSDSKKLTVLSILCMEGQESQLFEFFESFLPIESGQFKNIDKTIDLMNLLPEDKSFYSYSGSLTTPPCTENVNWVVFKQPIIISLEEVLKLKDNMPINNYRNEQPLNDRKVYYNY